MGNRHCVLVYHYSISEADVLLRSSEYDCFLTVVCSNFVYTSIFFMILQPYIRLPKKCTIVSDTIHIDAVATPYRHYSEAL